MKELEVQAFRPFHWLRFGHLGFEGIDPKEHLSNRACADDCIGDSVGSGRVCPSFGFRFKFSFISFRSPATSSLAVGASSCFSWYMLLDLHRVDQYSKTYHEAPF